jgi:hypothetical protein
LAQVNRALALARRAGTSEAKRRKARAAIAEARSAVRDHLLPAEVLRVSSANYSNARTERLLRELDDAGALVEGSK